MNETQIRTSILEALEAAYNATFSDSVERERFLSGTVDYKFDELDIDSFGMMEFCISLEINEIISITPEEVNQINTLNELVDIIEKSQ